MPLGQLIVPGLRDGGKPWELVTSGLGPGDGVAEGGDFKRHNPGCLCCLGEGIPCRGDVANAPVCPEHFLVTIGARSPGADPDPCAEEASGTFVLEKQPPAGGSVPCATPDVSYCTWLYSFPGGQHLSALWLWIGRRPDGDLDVIVSPEPEDGGFNDVWRTVVPQSIDCTDISTDVDFRCRENHFGLIVCPEWDIPFVEAF